jgi:FkbM family methyltransferase
MKIVSTLHAIGEEWRWSGELCAGWGSRSRLFADFFLSHLLFALPRSIGWRERRITTRSGVKLNYRMNRGDLQGIREVWCQEVYRLPFSIPSGALLDLGANIGLTTLWMATHYKFTHIVAVEPSHENAMLVQKNLMENGISGELIEAAVGPEDGTTHFRASAWSNMGCVADEGIAVRLISVGSILAQYGLDSLALAKVGIEGSEQALFLGPTEWLERTQAMIVEFHPTIIDYPLLTSTVASKGFKYIPASTQNMDCFTRA